MHHSHDETWSPMDNNDILRFTINDSPSHILSFILPFLVACRNNPSKFISSGASPIPYTWVGLYSPQGGVTLAISASLLSPYPQPTAFDHPEWTRFSRNNSILVMLELHLIIEAQALFGIISNNKSFEYSSSIIVTPRKPLPMRTL